MAIAGTLEPSDLHHDFGVGLVQAKKIRAVLASDPAIKRVILFGSRAKGTFRPSSDIDLAVDGLEGDLPAEALRSSLEDLAIPRRFDVMAIETISHPAMLDHIRRVGVVVYEAQRLNAPGG